MPSLAMHNQSIERDTPNERPVQAPHLCINTQGWIQMTATNLEAPAQIETVARILTTSAEAGQRIDQELNKMSPSERVQVAHQMEAFNTADRATNEHLPKLDFCFEHSVTAKDFQHIGGILPKVAFSATGQEFLTNIQIEKDPTALLFKDKQDAYDIKDTIAFLSETDKGKLIQALDGMNGGDKTKDLTGIYAKRQDIIDHLTPDQRRAYDAEVQKQIDWDHNFDIDPIAVKDSPPSLPIHEAIERMSNPSGKTDREEQQAQTAKAESVRSHMFDL